MRARRVGVRASKRKRVRARLRVRVCTYHAPVLFLSDPLARSPVRSRVRTLTRVYERENPGKATPDRRKRTCGRLSERGCASRDGVRESKKRKKTEKRERERERERTREGKRQRARIDRRIYA